MTRLLCALAFLSTIATAADNGSDERKGVLKQRLKLYGHRWLGSKRPLVANAPLLERRWALEASRPAGLTIRIGWGFAPDPARPYGPILYRLP